MRFFRLAPHMELFRVTGPVDLEGFDEEFKQAKQEGRLSISRENILMFGTGRDGEYILNTTRIVEHDATDAVSLSEAEYLGRKQCAELDAFVHETVPGFERAMVEFTGASVGVRGSRQLVGRYTLTAEDILECKSFSDRIAHSSNHQGVVLKAQPFQYSSLAELVDRADKKARAMEAATSEGARIAARPLFIALDGVTDPQNLGAVIRSAAAFGANGVILPERRSASVTAAAWKVSAGAAAHMPVARVVNLTKAIESLKERGYYSVGLDGGGDALVGETGFETDPLVVVLGSEGNGLSRLVREACDSIAGIPMSNMVESLNASVAAGITLYAVARARREAAAAK